MNQNQNPIVTHQNESVASKLLDATTILAIVASFVLIPMLAYNLGKFVYLHIPADYLQLPNWAELYAFYFNASGMIFWYLFLVPVTLLLQLLLPNPTYGYGVKRLMISFIALYGALCSIFMPGFTNFLNIPLVSYSVVMFLFTTGISVITALVIPLFKMDNTRFLKIVRNYTFHGSSLKEKFGNYANHCDQYALDHQTSIEKLIYKHWKLSLAILFFLALSVICYRMGESEARQEAYFTVLTPAKNNQQLVVLDNYGEKKIVAVIFRKSATLVIGEPFLREIQPDDKQEVIVVKSGFAHISEN